MQRLIMRWGFAWRAASRFVAGTTPAEAVAAVQQLNAHHVHASLDHLGENTTSEADAAQAARDVVEILTILGAREDVSANVSIKLSQIGLTVDAELCRANLAQILTCARQGNNFVRIDMEDSSLTDQTIGLYRWALEQGYQNTGIVLQAYLYRSEADVRAVMEVGGKVRLCKGAYLEPPSVAFARKADVDANYDRLATLLLESALERGAEQASLDGRFPPVAAIATHDSRRIHHVQAELIRLGLPQRAVEFQMLYGIRRDLQLNLAAAGYPLRVYVPYGEQWYPYFMRRMAERPANLWFVLRNYFHA